VRSGAAAWEEQWGAAQVADTTVDGKEISGTASLAPFFEGELGGISVGRQQLKLSTGS